DGALEPVQIGRAGGHARDPERRAVPEEDLAEPAADDSPDAPAPERFRRVLPGGAAAEVEADHQDRGALVSRLVERVLRLLRPCIGEDVLLEPLEGDALQVAGGDDPVGVDVVAGHRDAPAGHPAAGVGAAHRRISRTSATAPLMAAAATIAGLIRRVRPVGLPCRPMKLRFDDEAQISRPWSLSSFIPRHIEHPALRHSKPAAVKISWRPSASAAVATAWEPGTTRARTPFATFRPRATSPAARRSDSRPFVHEPMKATSIRVPATGWPGLKSMNASASRQVERSPSGARSGSGIRSSTPTDCPGCTPQGPPGGPAPPPSGATSS